MRARQLIAFALIAIGVFVLFSQSWKPEKADRSFEKTWTFSDADDLQRLIVRSDYNLTVVFEASKDGRSTVRINGKGTKHLAGKVQATDADRDGLELDLTDRSGRFLGFISFGFGRMQAEHRLVVAAPEGVELDTLRLSLDSANLKVSGESPLRIAEATLSTDSGNVDIADFSAEQLTLRTDSGNINGTNIAGEIDIGIDSGNIKLDNVTGFVNANADSGNITLDNVTGPVNANVDSGNMKVVKLDTSGSELKADSGSIEVTLPSSFAGRFDLKTDSGKITAPEPKNETSDVIEARVDSGNIVISIAE